MMQGYRFALTVSAPRDVFKGLDNSTTQIPLGFGRWCASSYEAVAGGTPILEGTWRLYAYPGGAANCHVTSTQRHNLHLWF